MTSSGNTSQLSSKGQLHTSHSYQDKTLGKGLSSTTVVNQRGKIYQHSLEWNVKGRSHLGVTCLLLYSEATNTWLMLVLNKCTRILTQMHQKRTISAYLVKMNCKIHHRHFNSTAISDLPVAVLVIKPSHFALKKKMVTSLQQPHFHMAKLTMF